jgi:transcriptional regulatory protein LevR
MKITEELSGNTERKASVTAALTGTGASGHMGREVLTALVASDVVSKVRILFLDSIDKEQVIAQIERDFIP